MTPRDPEIPPAGEQIHLPGPSIQPVLLTVGITIGLVGVTTSIVLVVAGAIVAIWVIIAWVRDTRRDVDRLPLH